MTAVLPTTTTLNNFFQTAPTSTTSTTSTSTSSAPTKESTIPITNSGSVAGVQLLQALLRSVRGLQTAYGNRNELATDADARVARLCDLWDSVLCHGLRRPAAGASNPAANATTVATALLQTVADRLTEAVTGQTIGTAAANSHHTSGVHFWTFALPHLTAHERERFSTLQNVASDYGRGRALLRAALNERSLERYVLVWLNAAELPDAYEPWAVMRDPEATNLLPSIAAGLGTILFAVLVDNGALNERIAALAELREHLRPEPIIVAPPPATRVKAGHARRRHLVSFGEESTDNEAESAAAPIVGSPGRTLSSMCLKQEDGSVVSSGNRADVVPPVEIFRRLDAVFDVQPELPSEIVEVWGPVDNVRSLEDVHPIEANLDLSANVEGNNNMPFYELVSEHDELIDYQLATQQAQHDDEGNSDPMLGDTNNTMPSASSVEDLAEHTTSSSSVHTEPMTDSGDGNGQSVVELLKERLHYLTERCVQLENRVAGLSLYVVTVALFDGAILSQ